MNRYKCTVKTIKYDDYFLEAEDYGDAEAKFTVTHQDIIKRHTYTGGNAHDSIEYKTLTNIALVIQNIEEDCV